MAEDLSRENSNYALAVLRKMLADGDVAADGRLPTERALAERLELGRRAIRRALEVLEAEGLVWRRQGAGTFIGPRPGSEQRPLGESVAELVEGTDFMEIMEVRLRLEPQLAQLAALRARTRDILRMRELADRISASDDADARELWDGALHRQIAQSAGNQLFLALFDVINRVRQDAAWQAIRERARRNAASVGRSQVQHLQIIDAIASHDPVRAGEAMRQHLLMLQDNLIEQTSADIPALPATGT